MDLFIIAGYTAICISLFAILRIPLNKWTVPGASVGGIVLTFVVIQLLNYYHPYSGIGQQHVTVKPMSTDNIGQVTDLSLPIEDRKVVAWFPESSLLRLKHGSETEVTFDGIPGKVFTGLVQNVIPVSDQSQDWARETTIKVTEAEGHSRVPVLIDVTDRRYARYAPQIPDGSRARAAVYGQELRELALVRKTLLHMSAWLSYLSPLS